MRKRIDFQKVIDAYPYDYPIEMKFEIFRWMVLTGWEYQEKGRWGSSGVFEWLYALSSVGAQAYWYDHGFHDERWNEKLTMCLIRAVAMTGVKPVWEWREAERVKLGGYRMLDLRIDSSTRGIEVSRDLDWLLSGDRRKDRLAVQLNSCHDDAREIECVTLTTNGHEWVAILRYGYDGSVWSHDLLRQKELTFGEFVSVARGALRRLVDGES